MWEYCKTAPGGGSIDCKEEKSGKEKPGPEQLQVSGGGKGPKRPEGSNIPKRISFRRLLPKEDNLKQVGETRGLGEPGGSHPGKRSTGCQQGKGDGEDLESGNQEKSQNPMVPGTKDVKQLPEEGKPDAKPSPESKLMRRSSPTPIWRRPWPGPRRI